jgi:glutathione S-transferase
MLSRFQTRLFHASILTLRFLSAAAATTTTLSTSTFEAIMMKHELIYFPAPGRAEPIRICLHIANAQWKDTRLPGMDWPAFKPSTPLGGMPLLKITNEGDDPSSTFTHCQSVALARYAAKLAGMYPDDSIQALFVDEVMDSLNEMMGKAPRKAEGMTDDDFKDARQGFQKTTMTKTSEFVESIIQTNGGGSSVAKGQATVADLLVEGLITTIGSGSWDHIDKDFFSGYPGMLATADAIAKNAGVVSYYESCKAE